MIDKRLIEDEIITRITEADIFDATDIAFPNLHFNTDGKSIYLEQRLGVIDEHTASANSEVAEYIIDLFIRVLEGTGTETINAKEKALGNLFDPTSSVNTYFVLGSTYKVNISSVETLTRTVFDDTWLQGIVRLNIKVNSKTK